jgi:two-component system CheB/CheR fusion protein
VALHPTGTVVSAALSYRESEKAPLRKNSRTVHSDGNHRPPADWPEGGAPVETVAPAVSAAFAVVGVGASAGGLDAFTRMLKALPVDTGMAFVLVQHLSPDRPSMLADILSRATTMPVTEVRDRSAVEPNHVYVIPSDRDVAIVGGNLQLVPRDKARGPHHPIDRFFRSLADDQAHRGIGVILSGNATDGTLGLREIKAAGGITFAQDDSAQYHGMPTSAVAAGCVDLVLGPAAIAEEIARIARHPYVVPAQVAKPASPADDGSVAAILRAVCKHTGVDFARYKASTLQRRISRRMLLHRIDGLGDYVKHLEENAAEAEALYQDILINVTSFFRNSEQFDALKAKFLPKLLEGRSPTEPLRAWVLGCSTGEEAYSLAMTLSESLERAGSSAPFQIFATDLNAVGIEKARAGVYPKSIDRDVSPERLARFFTEVDGGYRIVKSVRDECVFARHNVLTDPPLSRVEIASCRNLLIYLEPDMQQRIVQVLHFALNTSGLLLLGHSETPGSSRNLFELEDAGNRIYSKKAGQRRALNPAPRPGSAERRPSSVRGAADGGGVSTHQEVQRVLLERFAPPAVLINSQMEIVQFRGDTSPYLTPAQGKASLGVLTMVRPGLQVVLRTAILKAKKERVPVHVNRIQFADDDGPRELSLEVIPIPGAALSDENYLVVFDDEARSGTRLVDSPGSATPGFLGWIPRWLRDPAAAARPAPPSGRESVEAQTARLAQDLSTTREYLESIIETQEAANEELQSANEEAQSANEELQTINEELETSKEEIQAASEELTTVNDELQHRNVEIGQINNDLLNLIASVEIPIVMLGLDRSIRRFSPRAERMLHITPADIGRSVHEVKLQILVPDLERILAEVIDTASTREISVQDATGRWCALRIRPYRTVDDKVDGAVLMLVDVDTLQRARDYAESIVQAVHEPILVLDGALIVQRASRAYYEMFRTTPDETERRSFVELGARQWGAPGLQALLQEVRSGARTLDDFEVDGVFPGVGRRVMLLTARRLPHEGDGGFILVTIDDATARRNVETALHTRVDDLRAADQTKDEFLAMLAHELRGPLSPLRSASQILNDPSADSEMARNARATIERQSQTMARLIDDLLDVARITQRKIDLRRDPAELAGVLERSVELNLELSQSRGQNVLVSVPPEPLILNADAGRLEQVFSNLLNNASKFSERGTRIWLTAKLTAASGSSLPEVEIRVRDEGIGIAPEMLPRVFDLFVQADRTLERAQGGLGIGLTIVRRLVEMHGGTIEVRSEGRGKGSEFVVRLPGVRQGRVSMRESARGTGEAAPASGSGPRRIVVADDNVDSAESLAALLRLSGHEVRVAYDGPGAFEATTAFRPDVVVLDIGLPGMSGHDVARRIREDSASSRITMIAVTGYGQDDDISRSREAGFDHHLTKPVDIRSLKRLLGEASPKT